MEDKPKKTKDPNYVKEYNKLYYQKTKKCADRRKSNIDWNDPEQVSKYNKEYRERNKNTLEIKIKTKEECSVCFRPVSKQSYNHHIQSKFHQNALLVRERIST